MKRITKKLCSTVCALLAFSGNRGGALIKETLYLTKEILCNAIQYFECLFGYSEYNDSLNRSKYDIAHNTAHDIIKSFKNKPDTTDKKESKNYWPILEAIFGVSQFAHAFGHGAVFNNEYDKVPMIIGSILGSISLTDAYFRYRESNQNSESQISEKKEATQPNQMSSNPKNSKGSSSDKK